MNWLYLIADSLASKPSDLGLPSVGIDSGLKTIVNVVFTVLGLVSVIFVIAGGIKYILSGGDSAGIKNAKETITYAIVGLVISMLAFGIVNYVTGIK